MYVTVPPSDIKSRLLYCVMFHWDSDDSAALGMSRTSTTSQAEQKAAAQRATDITFLVAEEE